MKKIQSRIKDLKTIISNKEEKFEATLDAEHNKG